MEIELDNPFFLLRYHRMVEFSEWLFKHENDENLPDFSSIKKLNFPPVTSLFSFPSLITKFTNLESLKANNCIIQSLPEEIGNLTELRYLDLYQNEIREIPNTIGNLTYLVELNLGFNHLVLIPDTIDQLINLKKLTLHTNIVLTSLPENIGDLQSLEELHISGNSFKRLPKSITKMKSLKELSISDNFIEELPESFSKLEELENLYISDNCFKEFPNEILNLPKLKYLVIDPQQKSQLSPEFENKLESKNVEILIRYGRTNLRETWI